MTNATSIMPAFVFVRRRDVELEGGYILAGQLIVDIPKTKKLKKRDEQEIHRIIERLTADVPRMPPDEAAVVFGWRGGVRPPSAVDTTNDKIMGAWAQRSLTIGLRVDPRKDGNPSVDSDMLWQMGLHKVSG